MEQIIGIILVAVIGWVFERLSKQKREQKESLIDAGKPRLDEPEMTFTPKTQALKVKPAVLDIDRQPSQPVIPPVPEDEPKAEEALGTISAMPENDGNDAEGELQRWRRAVIDSEILARRF